MSGEMMVRQAVIAALRGDAALMARVQRVHDGDPVRASALLRIDLCDGADWGGKAVEGREVRLSIGLADMGAGAGGMATMIARVDAVLAAMGPLADGWQVASARLVRSRVTRAEGPARGWRGTVDYRLRVARLQ